jgi:hypothetical protein
MQNQKRKYTMKSSKSHSRAGLLRGIVAILVMAACLSTVSAAAPIALSVAGKKLEASYAAQMESLKAEIIKALPQVDNQKKADYQQAAEAESAANAHLKRCQAALKKSGGVYGLLGHRKKWMAEATGGVAHWKKKLKEAEAMTGEGKAEAVKAAQAALKVQQDGYKTVTIELKKAQDIVKAAELAKPKLTRDVEAARTALDGAKQRAMTAFKELGLTKFLRSDKLDAKLSKYVVMMEATPRGLAAFAQQGADQKKLIDDLLADESLLLQIVIADGAKGGKYGAAMTIYSAIQKASQKSQKGCLQRLALAVALEHAVSLAQGNPAAKKDAPKTVDPVKRYLHYEKAYLGKELDQAFKGLTVWEYRMIVDGRQPDEIIAWGREMLRSYRPDHITNPDYRWRYVGVVKTDIRYCGGYNRIVRPELQYTQHILMNGGVCGRRAFFGRFVLRAFGIPTAARPSPGHGALTHWTPDGWVICLGGGWGIGNTRTRYGADVNFLATTQARSSGKEFLRVKRAQWIGDVMGETRTFGLYSGKQEYWYGVSLCTRRAVIDDAKAVALAAVGTDLGEANVSKVKEAVKTVTISDEDRKIVVGNNGVITIPAAACSKPTGNTGRIKFMPSNHGGMQLHYSRTGNAETFEYSFNARKAGTYALTARVVTPSWKQRLQVAANGAKEPLDIALPFTVGMWETTQPGRMC